MQRRRRKWLDMSCSPERARTRKNSTVKESVSEPESGNTRDSAGRGIAARRIQQWPRCRQLVPVGTGGVKNFIHPADERDVLCSGWEMAVHLGFFKIYSEVAEQLLVVWYSRDCRRRSWCWFHGDHLPCLGSVRATGPEPAAQNPEIARFHRRRQVAATQVFFLLPASCFHALL